MRRLAASGVAWLLGLLLALGCAPDPTEPATPSAEPRPVAQGGPLTVTLLAGAAAPTPVELARFGVDDGWSSDAPGQSLLELPDGPVLQLGAGRPDQPLTLSRAWPELARRPTRVRVRHRFGGQGHLAVHVLAGQDVLASSEAVPLAASEVVAETDLVLPTWEGVAERLELVCTGAFRRLAVSSVTLLEDPLLRAVDGMLAADGRWRPGSVATPGARWRVDVAASVPGRVELAVGLPRGAASGASLRITSGDGETPAAELDATVGWRELSLPVDGPTSLTLELRGTAPCLLTAPRWRPADAAPTTTVLITSHAHRADHLGLAFRGVDIDTPHLDALAERGVLFTRAQGTSDLSVGALAALQTGYGARDTRLLAPGDRLSDEATTLAERLSAAGVTTLLASGDRRLTPPGAGLHQGFDVVVGPEDLGVWPAERVVAAALDLLERHAADGRPVFLWVHLADGAWPHEPDPATLMPRYHDPDDDPRHPGLKRPKVVAQTMPPAYRDVLDLNWARARYKARLTEADRALAPLLAVPRVAAGVVAFTADHGLSLGEHGIWFKHLGLYPATLHVPLILAAGRGGAPDGGAANGGPDGRAGTLSTDAAASAAPGGAPGVAATGGDRGLPAGSRCQALVSHSDLAATLSALAGQPGGLPGADLRGVLDGSRPPGPAFAVERHGLSAAVRDGDLLLVFNLRDRRLPHLVERRQAGEAEIYDLTDDWAGELPVSAERKAGGQALGFVLRDWLLEARDLGWRQPGPVDPAVLERMQSLGYLGAQPVTPADPWAAAREALR